MRAAAAFVVPVAPGGLDLARMRWRMALPKNGEWLLLEDGSALRALRVGGRPLVARVRPGPSRPEEPDEAPGPLSVAIEVWGEDAPLVEAAASRLVHCLSLQRSPAGFYRLAERDALLRPLARRYRGLRVVCDADPFESAVKAIAGQQVTMAFAGTLVRRLATAFGAQVAVPPEACPEPPRPLFAFPAPEALARADPLALVRMGFTRAKAQAIVGLARQVADGRLDFEGLARLPDEEALARLVALPGVGRWTAECVLLFGLGRPDVFPAADSGLRLALARRLGREERPGAEEAARLGEAWRPYRSLAALYLWETLHDPAPPAPEWPAP